MSRELARRLSHPGTAWFVGKQTAHCGQQLFGAYNRAELLSHHTARTVVIQAHGGKARAQGFQQSKAIAFVTGREDVQIGHREEGAFAFAGYVAGKDYSGSAELRGSRLEFLKKFLSLHERCLAADEDH